MSFSDRQDSAAAANEPAVLWTYRGSDQKWRVHLEGNRFDSCHPDRRTAIDAARAHGLLHGAYRLYLQMPDGCFALEMLRPSG